MRTLIAFSVMAAACAAAADGNVRIELNTVEPEDSRCRLNFVVENKSQSGIDSLRLDLVVFAVDGGILRRQLMEMAPLRPAKTMVRAFVIDAECRQLGALLVNDVTSCGAEDPNTCLDRVALSSRISAVRFYK